MQPPHSTTFGTADDGESASDDAGARIPSELDSPRAKLIYLYLRVHERADVEDIRRDLGLRRLALYPVLETLRTSGHVQQRGSTYVVR